MALEVYGRRNQMRDQEIIALYWGRDETAIQATHQKYGNYLFTIAYHILSNREDAEESLNDAYLTVWNTIPPERPRHLPAFLTAFPAAAARRRPWISGFWPRPSAGT